MLSLYFNSCFALQSKVWDLLDKPPDQNHRQVETPAAAGAAATATAAGARGREASSMSQVPSSLIVGRVGYGLIPYLHINTGTG